MKNRILKTVVAISMSVLLFGTTAFAAPKTMPDGSVFDSDYYAQQNPDVVAVMGTDESALYQHYKVYGQKEGRLPYAPTTVGVTEPTVVSTKQYNTGWVAYGSTPLISNALSAAIKNTVMTLQNRSDGIIIMTESTDANFMDVYTPTSAIKDQNGKDLAGKFYLNSVASMGAGTRVLCVNDGFITIYQYGLNGPSGTLCACEIFFEKK